MAELIAYFTVVSNVSHSSAFWPSETPFHSRGEWRTSAFLLFLLGGERAPTSPSTILFIPLPPMRVILLVFNSACTSPCALSKFSKRPPPIVFNLLKRAVFVHLPLVPVGTIHLHFPALQLQSKSFKYPNHHSSYLGLLRAACDGARDLQVHPPAIWPHNASIEIRLVTCANRLAVGGGHV